MHQEHGDASLVGEPVTETDLQYGLPMLESQTRIGRPLHLV